MWVDSLLAERRKRLAEGLGGFDVSVRETSFESVAPAPTSINVSMPVSAMRRMMVSQRTLRDACSAIVSAIFSLSPG